MLSEAFLSAAVGLADISSLSHSLLRNRRDRKTVVTKDLSSNETLDSDRSATTTRERRRFDEDLEYETCANWQNKETT